MIEIKNLVTQAPDDDGDIKVNLDLNYHNDTEYDFGLLRTRLNIFNCDGLLVESSQDFHEENIKTNEGWRDDLRSGYFKGSGLAGGQGALSLDIMPYRAFERIVGESGLSFPSIVGSGQRHLIHDEIELIGYTVTASKPDSDGDVEVVIRSPLRNVGAKHIPRAKIIGRILNNSGVKIDEFDGSGDSIMPGKIETISARTYIKKKIIQDVRVQILLKLFQSNGLEVNKSSLQ
jgi:hypothetical protein